MLSVVLTGSYYKHSYITLYSVAQSSPVSGYQATVTVPRPLLPFSWLVVTALMFLNKSVSGGVGCVWWCLIALLELSSPSHTRGPGRVALASGPARAVSLRLAITLSHRHLVLEKGKVTTLHRPARSPTQPQLHPQHPLSLISPLENIKIFWSLFGK